MLIFPQVVKSKNIGNLIVGKKCLKVPLLHFSVWYVWCIMIMSTGLPSPPLTTPCELQQPYIQLLRPLLGRPKAFEVHSEYGIVIPK